MRLSSVYVCVDDMERAVDFYREAFDREPTQVDERFSRFEFGAADFGLYDPAADGFDAEFGTNCVPNFEVDDIESAYERFDRIAPAVVHDEILEFGEYRTFHFVDTEGNEIEVFSIESG